MKKFKLFLVLFLVLFLNINSINAATLTNKVKQNTRTEINNYGVNKKWKITSSNKSNVLNTPYVDANEKVYDFANILTDEEEQTIYLYSKEFIEKTGMELIYLTIDMTYYSDSENEDYAADFYDYNDFGLDLEHYDGILLLRNNNLSDKYYDMYTFGKAQLYFDDTRYNDVLDSIYSEISNDNYLDGFKEFKDKCIEYYNSGIARKYRNAYIDENGFIKFNYSVPYLLCLVLSLVMSGIILVIFIKKNKMVNKATKASEYINKNSINYVMKDDRFITSRTTSYTVSSSSGSGGSSRGSSGGGHSSGGGRHG